MNTKRRRFYIARRLEAIATTDDPYTTGDQIPPPWSCLHLLWVVNCERLENAERFASDASELKLHIDKTTETQNNRKMGKHM